MSRIHDGQDILSGKVSSEVQLCGKCKTDKVKIVLYRTSQRLYEVDIHFQSLRGEQSQSISQIDSTPELRFYQVYTHYLIETLG